MILPYAADDENGNFHDDVDVDDLDDLADLDLY